MIDGDSFNDKTILRMRVIEEANLCGISVKTVRSDNYTLKVKGDRFFFLSCYSKRKGWVIKHAMVRENDPAPKLDETDIAEAEGDDENAACQTPFTSKWLVPIIISAIENKPGLSNGNLCSIGKSNFRIL